MEAVTPIVALPLSVANAPAETSVAAMAAAILLKLVFISILVTVNGRVREERVSPPNGDE
jgi:hypothetical protein